MNSQPSKLFISVLFFLTFLLTSNAFAKSHPYDSKFETEVRTLLFTGTQISPEKVEAYAKKLEQKRLEVVGIKPDGSLAHNSILIGKNQKKGVKPSEMKEELEKSEANIGFTYAISEIRKIKSTSSYAEVLERAYNAMDIESSVRIEGEASILRLLAKLVEAVTVSWQIPKVSQADKEASNLYNTRTGEYLSIEDMAAMKARGEDLSDYGPAQSTFWQAQPDISKVDIRQSAFGANLNIYKDVKVEFPADNTYYMEEVKHSDTKPKVDVYTKGADGKKQKFKLKFGFEIHADPTTSSLMMALGYPTDITRYSRNIKLIIGKTPLTKFIRDWEVYYRREYTRNKFLVEDQIHSTGKTLDGQNFIIFKEGLVEAKPKQVDRLGPWHFAATGNNSLREVRALTMISIWLDNTDSPDFVNNRLLLKQTGQGLQKYHIISDAGKALGSIFGSMPEAYNWNVVSSVSENDITLSYVALANSVKNKITFADAKWATRLIAALTKEQITAAVQLGSWGCMTDSFINKLISRRNNLVKTFGLIGERLPNGQVIQLMPFEKVSFEALCDKKQLKQDFTTNFDFNFGFLVSPILETTRNMILDSARGAFSNLERVVIKSDRFKTELNPIAEIIIDPKREIELNPHPKSAEDQYIVKEYLRLGIRYGAAYGAFVDNTYTIAFSLAYPARSIEEARLSRGFVINALLPIDIMKNKLPPSYVLLTEHSFEFGAGVNFDQKVAPSPISLKTGRGEVTLHRSILDHRDPSKTIFYREQSKFSRASLEAFLGISILKIPIFQSFGDSNGRAAGRGFILTPDEMGSREGKLLKSIVNGEFSDFKDLEKDFDLKNRFSAKSKSWNLIFIKSKTDKRLDNIILDQGDKSHSYIQYRIQKSRSRSLLSNVETRKVNVEVYSNPTQPEKFQINLSVIGFDKNTLDKELDLDYLGFINGLSMTNEPLIPFSPSLKYSTNGRWGDLVLNSDTYYYPAAVQKILSIQPAQYWQALAQSMKISASELEVLKTKFARYSKMVQSGGGPSRGLYVGSSSLLKSAGIKANEAEIISRSYTFLKGVVEAAQDMSLDKKVKKIADVIRAAPFVTRRGFYDSHILGAINRIVGEANFYSENSISTPEFTEANMIEEAPLRAQPIGKKQDSKLDYLVFSPITPTDLYNIFDTWF